MTNTLKPIQWIERTALNRSRKLQNSYTRIQQTSMKFYDVGVNLTDGQFKGVYHGRSHHQSDLEAVIDRASKVGVTDFLVTASNKSEVTECIELCKRYRSDKLSLYCTGGVHPCSVTQIKSADNPALYLQELKEVISEGKRQGVIKAFGEIGLDFDRFHFAPRDLQEKYFIEQLSIAADPDIDLPLFLHSRSCHQAFCDILYPMIDAGKFPRGGLVHSFTGTVGEMKDHISKGLYISVNGCSLKTEENLAVAKEIPLDRLMIETDAPWCEIRPTHASSKFLGPTDNEALSFPTVKKEKFKEGSKIKGRCEPCDITRVLSVMAALHGMQEEELAKVVYNNSVQLFGSTHK